MMEIRQVASDELRNEEVAVLRRLFDDAWGIKGDRFSDEDWEHCLGGIHFIIEEDGIILSHASVVPRQLHVGDHRVHAGYVEGVATQPSHWRRGYGTAVMREVGEYLDKTYELGALDTGSPNFYGRLGWIVWLGPTSVRTEQGVIG